MKKLLFFVVCLNILFSQQLFSQANLFISPGVFGPGTQAYFQAKYVQLGVGSCGIYGATDPYPASSYAWQARPAMTGLGFVADAGKNGWTVTGPSYLDSFGSSPPVTFTLPDYCGDYFVPGSPVEGWGVEFSTTPTGTGTSFVNSDLSCFGPDIPGEIVDTNIIIQSGVCGGDTLLEAVWLGTAPGGLRIEQKSQLPDTALYFITRIKFVNTNPYTLYNIYYCRNVDPDNEQPVPGGQFTTNNNIISQPTATDPCSDALVTATGVDFGCFLGIGARDPRARVTRGSFSTTTPISEYWNGGGGRVLSPLRTINQADEAISIAFKVDSLKAGDSTTFAFAHVLRVADLDCALSATGGVKIYADSIDITASLEDTICPGDSIRLTLRVDTAYRCVWTPRIPSAGLSDTVGLSVVVRPTVTTTYHVNGVKGSSTSGGCIIDKDITIYVTTKVAGASDSICRGDTASISTINGRYVYRWYSPPGVFTCDTCPTTKVRPLSTTTYYVSSFCGTDSIKIWVADTITPTTLPDTTICFGENARLGVSVTGSPSGSYTYSWSPTTDITNPSVANTLVQPTGNYRLSPRKYAVKIRSAEGCERIDTQTVILSGRGPIINFLPDTNKICPGQEVNINTFVTSHECGTNPIPPATFICDPANLAIADIGTGAGFVTTHSPFSSAQEQKMQILIRASELKAAGIRRACTFQDLFFDWFALGGMNVDNLDIKVGCTNVEELNAGDGFVPSTTFTTIFSSASYNPAAPPILDQYYDWDGFSNIIVEICYIGTGMRVNDAPNISTTTFTSVLYQTGFGFTRSCDDFSFPTQTNERPNINLIVCMKDSLSYTYNWTPDPPLVSCDTCKSVKVKPYNSTNYTLRVSDGRCSSLGNIDIIVDTAMIVNALKDTTICAGSNVVLDVVPTAPSPLICQNRYVLSNIPYSPKTLTTPNRITFPFVNSLTDTVTIGFPFEFFCKNYNYLRVSSNGYLTFDMTTFTAGCCSGQFVPTNFDPNNLIALAWCNYDPTSGGTVQYQTLGASPNRVFVLEFKNVPHWFSASDPMSGQILLYESTNIVEVHLENQPDTRDFHTLGIEDSSGTRGYAPPTRNGSVWTGASSEAYRFRPIYTGGDTLIKFSWSPSSSLMYDTLKKPVASPITTTKYKVTATYSNGCQSVDSLEVKVIEPFTLNATADPDRILKGSNSELKATVSPSGTYTYSWVPPLQVTNPSLSTTRTVNLDSTQTFVVEASYVDSVGGFKCTVYDTVTVIVIPPGFIEVPNAFTPNKDGKNELFMPIANPEVVIKDFIIFNRWGQIVHNNTKNGWDGTFLSEDQPIGTYVYYILADIPKDDGKYETKKLQGSFTLIR